MSMKMNYEDYIKKLTSTEKDKMVHDVLMRTINNLENNGNSVKSRPKYIEALKRTIKSILFNQDTDKVSTISLPTGCGKTTAVINSLSYILNTASSYFKGIESIKGTVILKLQIKDCNETVDMINSMVGEEVAYSFHSGVNGDSLRKNQISMTDLGKYPVVVLTHEGFMSLIGRNQKDRISKWTDSSGNSLERRRLIIDEEIANVKIIGVLYSDVQFVENDILESSNKEAYDTYQSFTKELRERFLKYDSVENSANILNFSTFKYNEDTDNTISSYLKQNCSPEAQNTFNKIASVLKNGAYVRHLEVKDNVSDDGDTKLKKIFVSFTKIDVLRGFYTTQLDATSTINHLYAVNSDFKQIELPNVKTYRNTHIYVYNGMTGSKSSIRKNCFNALKENNSPFPSKKSNYFIDSLIRSIIDITKYKEMVLVVFNDNEIEKLFNSRLKEIAFAESKYIYAYIRPKIKTAHYGELNGKNDWFNFDTCFMIGFQLYSYTDYPLFHLSAQKDKIDLMDIYDKVTFPKSNGARRYSIKQFEKVRVGLVASSLVQAMNRIKCRKIHSDGDTPETHIYLINKDTEIEKLIEQAMPKVHISHDWQIDYRPVITTKEKKEKVEPVDKLIDFIDDILTNDVLRQNLIDKGIIKNNSISKSYIKDSIKGLSNQNTWKEAIKHPRFIEFCEEFNIQNNRYHFKY